MKLPMIAARNANNVVHSLKVFGKYPKMQYVKVLIQRYVHTSSRNERVYETSRKGDTRYDQEDPFSMTEHVIRGAKMFIPETKKFIKEMRDYFSQDAMAHLYPPEGVVDKYFMFNGPESLNKWIVSCDSDYNEGYTTANVSITPLGTGLFSGNLCTHTPKTGTVKRAGFSNLKFIPRLKSFSRDYPYVFVAYTHLVLRVRGDGRSYMVNIHPNNMFDTSWLDLYSYVLHTRGGPYWQETKIPFNKFFLHSRGKIQNTQYRMELGDVKTFSITCADKNNGHFALEIDYVGCTRDDVEDNDLMIYETYEIPKYTEY